jgi:hypothetical protein
MPLLPPKNASLAFETKILPENIQMRLPSDRPGQGGRCSWHADRLIGLQLRRPLLIAASCKSTDVLQV